MTDAPKILLADHLKTLKLPTFLREYDKLARQCAAEGLDHVQFLARLVVTQRSLGDRTNENFKELRVDGHDTSKSGPQSTPDEFSAGGSGPPVTIDVRYTAQWREPGSEW